MSTTTIRLWFVRETEKARLYCKYNAEHVPASGSDLIWIPMSIIEHTTKRGIEHHVKLPDWWIEKAGL